MEEQKICYSPKQFGGFAGGRFVSEIFDSGEPGTKWDRLKLEIRTMAKDSPRIKTELRVYIFEDRERIPEKPVIISKHTDILLYGCWASSNHLYISGRYLYFEVELLKGSAVFKAYEITFPKRSFAEYLPAIYRENGELECFLAIYQNQYLDAEREIMNFHRHLNARQTNMLNWLAGLIGGEMFLRLPEQILRKLLGITTLLHKIKGTKGCVKLLVYTLTGDTPLIVDCADELTESERKLFGRQNGRFYLMLKSRPDIDPNLFDYLIKQFIPINAHYTKIILNETSTIGGLCFLGINSVISDKKQPVVGASRLGEDLRL